MTPRFLALSVKWMELPFPGMKETVGGVGSGGTIAVTLGAYGV